jgi:hypothetical protein
MALAIIHQTDVSCGRGVDERLATLAIHAWRCIGDAMTAIEKTNERLSEAEINRMAGDNCAKLYSTPAQIPPAGRFVEALRIWRRLARDAADQSRTSDANQPDYNCNLSLAPSKLHTTIAFLRYARSCWHRRIGHRAPRPGTAISTVPGGGTLPRSSSRAGSTGPSRG